MLTSCFEAEDKSYSGPDVVQFNNQHLGRITSTIPGITSQTLLSKSVRQGTVTMDSVEVQLIGRQKDVPNAINYSVAPASTAVEGVHYSLVTPNQLTLPANTSSVYLKYQVLSGLTTAGTTARLIFNLEGNDVIAPAENYKTFTVTIVR